jgi:ankyrin repeat protein
MRVMLREGAGITPEDIAHALHHAVQLPHINPEIVEVLIATGRIPEPFCLLYRSDVDALRKLVVADGDVIHQRDATGCPLLLRAAENAQEQVARYLLEQGADVEARPITLPKEEVWPKFRLVIHSGLRRARNRLTIFERIAVAWKRINEADPILSRPVSTKITSRSR